MTALPPVTHPPSDFAQRSLTIATIQAGSSWRRIYNSKYPDPLGHQPALSRFSDPSGRAFSLVYLGASVKVAFVEAVLRDRAVGASDPFILTEAELNALACAEIVVGQSLRLVDLTGDGQLRNRVPTDVTRAKDQTLSRIWSQAFYDHPADVDGIVYESRLNGQVNIAVYDRSVIKLNAGKVPKLVECETELASILDDYAIALV